jgi:hypothetical protein
MLKKQMSADTAAILRMVLRRLDFKRGGFFKSMAYWNFA